MGKTNKVFGIIGGIHFLCVGLLLSLTYCLIDLSRKISVNGFAVKIPRVLGRYFLMPLNRDRNFWAIVGSEAGAVSAVLILAIFVLIAVGLLARKRLPVIIGSGLGILFRFLAGLGVFNNAFGRFDLSRNISIQLRTLIYCKVLLAVLLLAILYFVMLLLAACIRRASRIFGWIGAGIALLGIIPACFCGASLMMLRSRFQPTVPTILLGLLLAFGAVCVGETMRAKLPPQEMQRQTPLYQQAP